MSETIGILRNDGLGDLILTLPLVIATTKAFPRSRIILFINPSHAGLSEVVSIEGVSWVPLEQNLSFRQTVNALRIHRLSALLAVYGPLKAALAAWKLRIPLRVGYAYKPSRFLFNRKVFVHRSHPPIHESLFALSFLKGLGVESQEAPKELLKNLHISLRKNSLVDSFKLKGGPHRLIGIHPGSYGSALNWPVSRYAELLRRLSSIKGFVPVLSGSAKEEGLIECIIKDSGTQTLKAVGLDLPVFAAILGQLAVLVAPSTGVLHLASLLGVKTLGLFSPLKAHSPLKWAPLGGGKILIPSLPPKLKGMKMKCLSDAQRGALMSGIGVDEVLLGIHELIDTDKQGL
jgi:ADP-heptose:LPS heptosyltransferase